MNSKFTVQVKGEKEVKTFQTLNLVKDYLVTQTSNWWFSGSFSKMYALKIFREHYAEIELEETYIIRKIPPQQMETTE